MRTVVVMLVLGVLWGCAGVPERLTESPVPPDFSLEVRDYTPGAGALFIIEPDGMFRAAAGAEPRTQVYPPATRRLSAEQMASVWEAVSAAIDGDGVEASSAVINATAGGRRTAVRVDPASDADAARLLVKLRRLAWLEP